MTASIWRVLGASVPGTSHLTLGRECQDSHAAARLADGSVVVAVADGAGSATRAADGANCAVDTAVSLARDRLAGEPAPMTADGWQAFLTDVFVDVRGALEVLAAAAESDDALRELATTLLVGVITAQWLAVAQVGDGAVVVQRTDASVETITTPDHGEYINQTSFLTDATYLAELQYVVLPAGDINGVALFTDGLERLALLTTSNEAHTPFFRPLFAFAAEPDAAGEEVERFLYSDRVCERTDDDKTLVLAVRKGSEGA